MDFEEFEQLVLKVLFETEVPVTAAHTAYLGRLSVRSAERHLARMVEQGTLLVRTNAEGIVEYFYPGRKPLVLSAVSVGMLLCAVAATLPSVIRAMRTDPRRSLTPS